FAPFGWAGAAAVPVRPALEDPRVDVDDQSTRWQRARVLRVARAWFADLDRARLAARFGQPLPLAQAVSQHVGHPFCGLAGVFVSQERTIRRETVDTLPG